jgi:hypothetical protein
VYLPNLESIGASSFQKTAISTVSSLGNITEVGISSFEGCKSLKKCVLPSTLQSIGGVAFYQCTALESVILHSVTPPTLAGNAFAQASNTFKIYVPDGSVDDYKAANNWKNFASRIYPLSEYQE